MIAHRPGFIQPDAGRAAARDARLFFQRPRRDLHHHRGQRCRTRAGRRSSAQGRQPLRQRHGRLTLVGLDVALPEPIVKTALKIDICSTQCRNSRRGGNRERSFAGLNGLLLEPPTRRCLDLSVPSAEVSEFGCFCSREPSEALPDLSEKTGRFSTGRRAKIDCMLLWGCNISRKHRSDRAANGICRDDYQIRDHQR